MEIILYVLEIMRYGVLYHILFSRRVKRLWMTAVVGVVLMFIFAFNYLEFSDSGKAVCAYIGTLLAMMVMMQGKVTKRVSELVILFLALNIMARVCMTPFRIYELYMRGGAALDGNVDTLVSSISGLAVLVVIELWRKRYGIKKRWIFNSRFIYALVIAMVIEMLITVTVLNDLRSYVQNLSYSMEIIILGVVAYVSIGLLGIFVVHVRNVNVRMEEMLHNETGLKEMQRTYYETLLEKEKDTRKYRHDMANHMLCLEYLVEKRNIEKLKEYLAEMQQQMVQIQKKSYSTGNQILDVLTNHYIALVDEKTEVHVKGRLIEECNIEQVALCTIYGNLLKNAVEELERIEKEQKILFVEFLQGTQYVQINIKNTVSEKTIGKKKILATEKGDKRNHGIGLQNIKRAVKECGGELNLKCDKEFFEAQVILRKEDGDRSRTYATV